MLKIKDNVDLKELEKFGFVEYQLNTDKVIYVLKNDEYSFIVPDFKDYSMRDYYKDELGKKMNTLIGDYFTREHTPARIIDIVPKYYEWGTDLSDLDVLFDLIQAGLVEKVGE